MFKHTPVGPRSGNRAPVRFCFIDKKLLVRNEGDAVRLPGAGAAIPPASEPGGVTGSLPGIGRVETVRDLFLGTLDGTPCRAVELRLLDREDERPVGAGSPGGGSPGGGFDLMGLRALMGRMDWELLRVAGVASQVLDWDRNHQFCGRCGKRTIPSDSERSRTCPSCSLTAYPRISPAIIVAVTRGDKILLGHNRRHRAGHVFSVLAGFVEPGESLEECVRREVMEEVSIELGEIRYFASQPWPFPDSLMIAFTAAYKSGEIEVDGTEIVEADWFDRDHLPEIPPHGTVARRLIDWFSGAESVKQTGG